MSIFLPPSDLVDLVKDFDILGMAGHDSMFDRCNLLLGNVSTSFENDTWLLHGTPLTPEGGSARMFQNRMFNPCPDKAMNQDVCTVLWTLSHEPPCHSEKMLVWNVMDSFHHMRFDVQWVFDHESVLLPLSSGVHSQVHVLETFAGATGGWSAATRFLQHHCNIPFQTISLDSDALAVQGFVMTHDSVWVDAQKPIPCCFMDGISRDVTLHGDISHTTWWAMVARWEVDIMTISAPCPPWSSASSGQGVESHVGLLFPQAILTARVFRPKILLVEQVNGFQTHRHKRYVLDLFRHVGYDVKWSAVLDSACVGAAKRLRWLAIAVRMHSDQVTPLPFQMWPKLDQCTPVSLNAIFSHEPWDFEKLKVSQLIEACASDHLLLPPAKRIKGCAETKIDPLQERTTKVDEVANTFMALYGSQHTLDKKILMQRGYLGHFLSDHSGTVRLFHPLEILLIHVAFHRVYIEKDMQTAWRHAGNCITLPHALLLLSNAVSWIDNACDKCDVAQVFQALVDACMNMSFLETLEGRFGTLVMDSRTTTKAKVDQLLQSMSVFDEVCQLVRQTRLLPLHGWSLETGILPLDDLKTSLMCGPIMSPITIQDSPDEVEPTAAFNPKLKALIQLDDFQLIFWVDSGVSFSMLESMFHDRYRVFETGLRSDGISLVLTRKSPCEETLELQDRSIFHEGMMTVVAIESSSSIKSQISSVMHTDEDVLWFDQAGLAQNKHPSSDSVIVSSTPLVFQPCKIDPCFVMSGAALAATSVHWDPLTDSFTIEIVGQPGEREILASFWSQLLSPEVIRIFGITCRVQSHESGTVVNFCPSPGSIPICPDAFASVLSIAAAKALLGGVVTPGGIDVLIKLHSKQVWAGSLHEDMNALVLTAMLTYAFLPSAKGRGSRLFHRSRRCCDVTLAELRTQTTSEGLTLRMAFEISGGTGGSKDGQKIHARNSMAATLLEQGYSLDWVSKTIDILLQNVGLKKCLQIIQLPPSKQRVDSILGLCKECGIQVSDKLVKDASKVTSLSANAMKQRKKIITQPDPAAYTIEPGYVCNEDGSAAVQISELRANVSGILLMSHDQALPWIRESKRLSKDELAAAVIGQHGFDTSLATIQMNIPCRDQEGRAVILAATVVQFGDKHVRTPVVKNMIKENDSITVAVTMWKSDWNDADWAKAVDQPIQFVKSVLAKQNLDDTLQTCWGKSLRNQRSPTMPAFATSVQFHTTISQERISEVLSVSGWNGIFMVPKTIEGRLSEAWRIVWSDGNYQQLTTLSTQTNHCEGLVKGKKAYGLRFKKQFFDAAWQVIHPSKPVPSEFSTKFLFRVEPLPFGTTAEVVGAWSQSIGWPIRALKALGPRSWLVGSSQNPPEGVNLFNSSPLLIKPVQSRGSHAADPVIAGPRPRKHELSKKPQEDAYGPHFDPWSSYQPTPATGAVSSVQPQRSIVGPTETRFAATDDRINKLEVALTKLQQDTQQAFQQVEVREAQNQQAVKIAIDSVKSELESSLRTAINQQSVQLNDTLADLKSLIIGNHKRKNEDEADMADMKD